MYHLTVPSDTFNPAGIRYDWGEEPESSRAAAIRENEIVQEPDKMEIRQTQTRGWGWGEKIRKLTRAVSVHHETNVPVRNSALDTLKLSSLAPPTMYPESGSISSLAPSSMEVDESIPYPMPAKRFEGMLAEENSFKELKKRDQESRILERTVRKREERLRRRIEELEREEETVRRREEELQAKFDRIRGTEEEIRRREEQHAGKRHKRQKRSARSPPGVSPSSPTPPTRTDTYPTESTHSPNSDAQIRFTKSRRSGTRRVSGESLRGYHMGQEGGGVDQVAGPLSKQDIMEIFSRHERQWRELGHSKKLSWSAFPWPMFTIPSTPEDITELDVSTYINSPLYPEHEKPMRDRIRDHLKRWHPDRFEPRFSRRVIHEDVDIVSCGAGLVVRHLNKMLDEVS